MTRVPLESPLVWVAFATAAWEAGKEVLGSAKKRAERSSGEAAAGSSGSPLSRTASATLAPVTPRVPQEMARSKPQASSSSPAILR
ncbi:hypothetical protein COHA_001894 [Chlorella ohadii]|uniref:Uncharacterized protein n=1 Tax=Chlorella ohadii TaxID=2649997 RepID=A0AAD5H5F1_9CHLO|nr:hypothetical protein COHA_001894 [Chlorella ohadii]